jgi:hypothetical protein
VGSYPTPGWGTGVCAADDVIHVADGDNFGVYRFVGVGGETEPDTAPSRLTLMNYPNPTRDQGCLRFALSAPSFVQLTLLDVGGRVVRTVIEGERGAGFHTESLCTMGLPSGSYLCRLATGSGVATSPIVILR